MKVRLPSFAYSEKLKVPEEPKAESIPDNIPLPELAEQVVRGKVKLTPAQQRMLIELLPFYMPKLSAVGYGVLNNETFAEKLDRAIARSDRAKLIEGRVILRDEVSEETMEAAGAVALGGFPTLMYRTYCFGCPSDPQRDRVLHSAEPSKIGEGHTIVI